MKLNEAILRMKNIKSEVVRYAGLYNSNKMKDSRTVEKIAVLLKEYSDLETRVLKTNLSYKVTVKDNDEEVDLPIQELYRKIKNNLIILELLNNNLNNEDDTPVNYFEDAMDLISSCENRLAYLQNILLETDITVDLLD